MKVMTIKFLLTGCLLLLLGTAVGFWLSQQPFVQDRLVTGISPSIDHQAQPVVEQPDTGTPQVTEPAADTVEDLTFAGIKQVLMNVAADQRQQLIADDELFRRFIEQEARNHSLKSAAYANGLHTEENVIFLRQRAADNVLREAYLDRLMKEQLPADFPNDEQVQQYYEQNPARFSTVERQQLWQVFLPVNEQAAPESIAATEKQAKELHRKIVENKISFGDAAVEYSAHAASRQNDGFMGTIAEAELKPAFATALKDIEENETTLVRSDEGWHILKKGRHIAAHKLPFREVEPQVRQLLLKEAHQQFRNAVYEQAAKKYPFMPGDNRIEQWRLQIKTSQNSSHQER